MEEISANNESTTPEEAINKANPNPTNSLLIEQFLQDFKTNKLGACLEQFDNGKIVLFEREMLDGIQSLVDSKRKEVAYWENKFEKQGRKLAKVDAARIQFHGELKSVFTTLKQILKLGSSIKPFNELIDNITNEARVKGIDPKNKVRFGWFIANKVPEIMDVIFDEKLHEKIKATAAKIDLQTPLRIMIDREVLPPEYADYTFINSDPLLLEEQKALPPPSSKSVEIIQNPTSK